METKKEHIARSAWKLWATAAELSWKLVAELSEFTNSGNATSQELDTVVIKASGVVPFSVMLKNRVISE